MSQQSASGVVGDGADLLDLPNICFMGTNVVSGTATAIVGSCAETAFDRGVNGVSWLLIRFMLVMVPLVLLINGFTKGNWMDALLFAPASP